jgi:hypothetical protein
MAESAVDIEIFDSGSELGSGAEAGATQRGPEAGRRRWGQPKLQKRWEHALAALRDFAAAAQGRFPRKRVKYVHGGVSLNIGVWLGAQRRAKQRGALAQERIDALDAAVPGWEDAAAANMVAAAPESESAAAGEDSEAGGKQQYRRRMPWKDWLHVLRKYVEENSVCPSCWDTWTSSAGEVYKIGGWLRRQRLAKKSGRMSQDQEKMLDEVYAGWKKYPRHAVQKEVWENWLEVMVEYAAAKGELPRTNDEWKRADGSVWGIGGWRRRQRILFKKNKLSADRAEALSEAAPGWNDPETRIETAAI